MLPAPQLSRAEARVRLCRLPALGARRTERHRRVRSDARRTVELVSRTIEISQL